MSVYLTIPSKKARRDAQDVLAQWDEMGYKLAIWRDSGDEPVDCDILVQGEYPGYAAAVNRVIAAVRENDPEANWFVAAGDDILPDRTKSADEIAAECEAHFREYFHGASDMATFGVMQPTGDAWSDSAGRMIERIAGSPFIGRAFAERINGGKGPYWEEYRHCFLDNEIMDVAKKYGVFLQRPDLTHMHHHWTREGRPMPGYLADANSPAHWNKYMAIYSRRKSLGFPGSEPIEHLAAMDQSGSSMP